MLVCGRSPNYTLIYNFSSRSYFFWGFLLCPWFSFSPPFSTWLPVLISSDDNGPPTYMRIIIIGDNHTTKLQERLGYQYANIQDIKLVLVKDIRSSKSTNGWYQVDDIQG
jgi:hypothetical protein